jgi:GT2 family glycosyltransferase/glycosyltransferase involved in cell wall biosynthesis
MIEKLRIVLPVHNARFEVRRCLLALRASTRIPYELEIVNDLSDELSSALLRENVSAWPEARLVEQEHQLGFVGSVNAAFERARADGVALLVVLNSDVTVTPFWLARLLEAARRDPNAALLTPLSNEASIHSFSIPPGWNVFQLADALASEGRSMPTPDLVTASGFLMLLRVSVMPEPLFDPIFGTGYGEESDLSMRLRSEGKGVVAAPTCFVHHVGKASFGPQHGDSMATPNYQVFMERWRESYHADLAQYRADGQLSALRRRFPMIPSQGFFSQIRLITRIGRERGWTYTIGEASRRGLAKLRASIAARGFRHTFDEAAAQVQAETVSLAPKRQPASSGAPRVLFLLEELNRAGGVAVVIDLVDALIARGWEAQIAVPADAPRDMRALRRCLFMPIFYRNPSELGDEPYDIVVSTLWSTAASAKDLVSAGRAGEAWSFIQDDERRFYRSSALSAQVEASYRLVARRIVSSSWLALELGQLGLSSEVIPPGIQLDDFETPAPRLREDGPVRVLALARPEKPRRGFTTLCRAMSALGKDVQPVFFGSPRARGALRNAEVHGFLEARELAALMRTCDMYVDASPWQAFGLPNFEAMASGLPVIGPREGGFASYAEHGRSAWLVDSAEAMSVAAGIRRLASDPQLRLSLAKEGQALARRLRASTFHEAMSRALLEGLRGILGERPAPASWAFL